MDVSDGVVKEARDRSGVLSLRQRGEIEGLDGMDRQRVIGIVPSGGMDAVLVIFC